jgi:hypothetical protein
MSYAVTNILNFFSKRNSVEELGGMEIFLKQRISELLEIALLLSEYGTYFVNGENENIIYFDRLSTRTEKDQRL